MDQVCGLEPALQNAAMAAAFDELLAPLVERYDSGERAKAVHVFMRTATNPDWRNQTEERLPGAVARAEDDAAATFHAPSITAYSLAGTASRNIGPFDGHDTARGRRPRGGRIPEPDTR